MTGETGIADYQSHVSNFVKRLFSRQLFLQNSLALHLCIQSKARFKIERITLNILCSRLSKSK